MYEYQGSSQICESEQSAWSYAGRYHARKFPLFPLLNHGASLISRSRSQIQVPSLIQSAREHGLLLVSFGTIGRVPLTDAHMSAGV